MLGMLVGMDNAADETGRYPIGVVLQSDGELARKLVAKLESSATLNAQLSDEDALLERMSEGYISCILKIGPDYDDNVRAGKTQGLLTVVRPEGEGESSTILDMIAALMMEDICFYKTYEIYDGLDGADAEGALDLNGFKDYTLEVAKDPRYGFSFDTVFTDTKSKSISEKDITLATIYRQVTAAIMGLMILVLSMCGCNGVASDAQSNLKVRKKAMGYGMFPKILLEGLAVVTYLAPAALIGALAVIKGAGAQNGVKVFLINILLASFAVAVFMAVALVLKNVQAYQTVAGVLCFAAGVLGVISVISAVSGSPMFESSVLGIYIKEYTTYLV